MNSKLPFRNGKFKEWTEVKVIENEHISKNLVLHI